MQPVGEKAPCIKTKQNNNTLLNTQQHRCQGRKTVLKIMDTWREKTEIPYRKVTKPNARQHNERPIIFLGGKRERKRERGGGGRAQNCPRSWANIAHIGTASKDCRQTSVRPAVSMLYLLLDFVLGGFSMGSPVELHLILEDQQRFLERIQSLVLQLHLSGSASVLRVESVVLGSPL